METPPRKVAFKDHFVRHSYTTTGWDLTAALAAGGKFDECRTASTVLKPLLEILDQRHSQGAVHGDLHPSNIQFSASGRLKLVDLSSAVTTDGASPINSVSALAYMAPELYPCAGRFDTEDPQALYGSPAVDVWAVGVLTCELLLGKVPAELARFGRASPPAPAPELELPTWLSTDACAFIRCTLCRDPRQRPSIRQLLKHAWLQQFTTEPDGVIVPSSAAADVQAAVLARTSRRLMAQQLQQRFPEPRRTSSGAPLKPTPLETIAAMLAPLRRPNNPNRIRPSPSSMSLASLHGGSGDSLDQSMLMGIRTQTSAVLDDDEALSRPLTPAARASSCVPRRQSMVMAQAHKGYSCPATPEDSGKLQLVASEGLCLPHISSPGMSESADVADPDATGAGVFSPRKPATPVFRITTSKSAGPAAAHSLALQTPPDMHERSSSSHTPPDTQELDIASPFQMAYAAPHAPNVAKPAKRPPSRGGSWPVLLANLEARQDALASLMNSKGQRSGGGLVLNRGQGALNARRSMVLEDDML